MKVGICILYTYLQKIEVGNWSSIPTFESRIYYFCHNFKITRCITNDMAYDVPKVVAPDALGGVMLYAML